MSIPKISFTSENKLLNSMYNKVQASAPNPAPVEAKVEQKAEQNLSQNQEKEQIPEKNNNKVRNWTIGLSSAAVLTALGVVAGRRGYLGEGVQRFLGAAKKETTELLSKSELEDLVEEVMGDLEGKGAEVVEPQTILGRVDNKADDIVGSVVDSSGAKLASKLPDNFDPDAINAKLDLTIPKITDPLKLDKIPDPLEGVDPSLGKLGDEFSIELKNGNTRIVKFSDGNFSSAVECDPSGKKLYSWSVSNANFIIHKDDRRVVYNRSGKLCYIVEKGKDGYERLISISIFSDDIFSITHLRNLGDKLLSIKDDTLRDGVRIKEEFYDETGKRIIFSRDLK